MGEAGIGPGSIVTYWTKISWRDVENSMDGNLFHMVTWETMQRASRSKQERANAAIETYNNMIQQRFWEFEASL